MCFVRVDVPSLLAWVSIFERSGALRCRCLLRKVAAFASVERVRSISGFSDTGGVLAMSVALGGNAQERLLD